MVAADERLPRPHDGRPGPDRRSRPRRDPFEPLPGDVTFVPYGDVEALRAAVDRRPAAVILEPIQGEAGVVVPPPGYLRGRPRITDDAGALLDPRRGADRHRPHRALVRPPAHARRPPRRRHPGQGARRRACRSARAPARTAADAASSPGTHGSTFGGNPVVRRRARRPRRDRARGPARARPRDRGEQLRTGAGADRRASREVRGAGLLLGRRAGRSRSPRPSRPPRATPAVLVNAVRPGRDPAGPAADPHRGRGRRTADRRRCGRWPRRAVGRPRCMR